MRFWNELKRRNVVRVAALYIVASWVMLQVAAVLFEVLELPPEWTRVVLAVLVLGFPLALIFAWACEVMPDASATSILEHNDLRSSNARAVAAVRKCPLLQQ